MAKVELSVQVEKETYELAQALAGLVVALLQKKPLSEIIASELTAVLAGVSGVEQIPSEAKEDMPAFIKSFALAGADIAGALMQKKA